MRPPQNPGLCHIVWKKLKENPSQAIKKKSIKPAKATPKAIRTISPITLKSLKKIRALATQSKQNKELQLSLFGSH